MALRATFERILLEAPLPRSSHSLNVVGNTAYLFGGELRPREPVDNAVHVFDLPASSSSTTATIASETIEASNTGDGEDVPSLRVGHASARIKDDIYVFGGRDGVDPEALAENGRVWRFSTANRKWTALDPVTPSRRSTDDDNNSSKAGFPGARSYHASAAASELGKIFIHAGCPASGRQNDLWSFDVNETTWTQLSRAPEPPRGGPGFTYALGKVWRYGGFDGKNELGGQLDYIDVSQESAHGTEWQIVRFEDGHCPGARSVTGLQVVHVQENPYLVAYMGERDASNLGHAGAGVFWGDVWTLALTKSGEVEGDKWYKCDVQGELPERGWFASDLVGQDKILIYGGLNAKNDRESDGILISFQKP